MKSNVQIRERADIDFSAKRFDDPRYEFVFRAQAGETIEGYCARRAIERAERIRELEAENEALKEHIRMFKDALDSGRLVDPNKVQIIYAPVQWPPEVDR